MAAKQSRGRSKGRKHQRERSMSVTNVPDFRFDKTADRLTSPLPNTRKYENFSFDKPREKTVLEQRKKAREDRKKKQQKQKQKKMADLKKSKAEKYKGNKETQRKAKKNKNGKNNKNVSIKSPKKGKKVADKDQKRNRSNTRTRANSDENTRASTPPANRSGKHSKKPSRVQLPVSPKFAVSVGNGKQKGKKGKNKGGRKGGKNGSNSNSSNNSDNDGNTAEGDSSGFHELYSEEFLDLLDRIRLSGGVPKVPQIVLLGHKGCGKTSLLELITGIRLPKGKDHSTFCPLEFNIVRSLKHRNLECTIEIKWLFDDDEDEFLPYNDIVIEEFATIKDISKLYHYVQSAQDMIKSSMQYSISPNTIVINVYAANVEDIRIVDLPGWIGNKNDDADDLTKSPQSGSDDDDDFNQKLSENDRRVFYQEIVDLYIKDSNDQNSSVYFSELKGGVSLHTNTIDKHDASSEEAYSSDGDVSELSMEEEKVNRIRRVLSAAHESGTDNDVNDDNDGNENENENQNENDKEKDAETEAKMAKAAEAISPMVEPNNKNDKPQKEKEKKNHENKEEKKKEDDDDDKNDENESDERENNIAVFMISSDHDFEETNGFELIEMYAHRVKPGLSIGIISNLDKIRSENDASFKKWVLPCLMNEKYVLKNGGFVGLHAYNPNNQRTYSIQDYIKEESQLLINTQPWCDVGYRMAKENFGFDNTHMSMVDMSQAALNGNQRDIMAFSNSSQNLMNQNNDMTGMVSLRDKLGSDSLMTKLGQLMMRGSMKGEFDYWKGKFNERLTNIIKELRTLPPELDKSQAPQAVSTIVNNFVNELNSHMRRDVGFERTMERIEKQFMIFRKDVIATRPRLATKGVKSAPQKGIYTVKDLVHMTNFTKGAFPQMNENIVGGVRHFLIEKIINKWNEPAVACMSNIHALIGNLLDHETQKHIHQFPTFQNNVRQTLAEVLGKLLGTAKTEITTILRREQLSPIVDVHTLKQKVQAYEMRLHKKKDLIDTDDDTRKTITEILAQAWGYFDIASTRFCDNISMVVQSTMVRSLTMSVSRAFTEYYLSQTPDYLSKLLVSDSRKTQQRKHLMANYSNLKNVVKKITDLYPQKLSLMPIDSLKMIDDDPLSRIKPLDMPSSPQEGMPFENEKNHTLRKGQTNSTLNLHAAGANGGKKNDTKNSGRGGDTMHQTNGERGAAKGESGNDDDPLMPVDFYAEYMKKKQQLDEVVPKLATLNAQLAADKKKLEIQKKTLKEGWNLLEKERESIKKERTEIIAEKEKLSLENEELNNDYEELNELREEFDKEKEDFLAQKDELIEHITQARVKLQAAAHKLVIEREKFEKEKEEFEKEKKKLQTSGYTSYREESAEPSTPAMSPNTPSHAGHHTDGSVIIKNVVQGTKQQVFQENQMLNAKIRDLEAKLESKSKFGTMGPKEEFMKQQFEQQKMLMEQMQIAINKQMEQMAQQQGELQLKQQQLEASAGADGKLEMPSYIDSKYLVDEWTRLEKEKASVNATVLELEEMMNEITEAEAQIEKDRIMLDTRSKELQKVDRQLQDKDYDLDEREEHLIKFETRLEQWEEKLLFMEKKLKEKSFIDEAKYVNKIERLKTQNKYLIEKIKNYNIKVTSLKQNMNTLFRQKLKENMKKVVSNMHLLKSVSTRGELLKAQMTSRSSELREKAKKMKGGQSLDAEMLIDTAPKGDKLARSESDDFDYGESTNNLLRATTNETFGTSTTGNGTLNRVPEKMDTDTYNYDNENIGGFVDAAMENVSFLREIDQEFEFSDVPSFEFSDEESTTDMSYDSDIQAALDASLDDEDYDDKKTKDDDITTDMDDDFYETKEDAAGVGTSNNLNYLLNTEMVPTGERGSGGASGSSATDDDAAPAASNGNENGVRSKDLKNKNSDDLMYVQTDNAAASAMNLLESATHGGVNAHQDDEKAVIEDTGAKKALKPGLHAEIQLSIVSAASFEIEDEQDFDGYNGSPEDNTLTNSQKQISSDGDKNTMTSGKHVHIAKSESIDVEASSEAMAKKKNQIGFRVKSERSVKNAGNSPRKRKRGIIGKNYKKKKSKRGNIGGKDDRDDIIDDFLEKELLTQDMIANLTSTFENNEILTNKIKSSLDNTLHIINTQIDTFINHKLNDQASTFEQLMQNEKDRIVTYYESQTSLALSKIGSPVGVASPKELPSIIDDQPVGPAQFKISVDKAGTGGRPRVGGNGSVDSLEQGMAAPLTPTILRQSSHSANPNNPFEDSDSDSSDWNESLSSNEAIRGRSINPPPLSNHPSSEYPNSVQSPNIGGVVGVMSPSTERRPGTNTSKMSEQLEITGLTGHELRQSLANAEDELHLTKGMEALTLDDEEIEVLRKIHKEKPSFAKVKEVIEQERKNSRGQLKSPSKSRASRSIQPSVDAIKEEAGNVDVQPYGKSVDSDDTDDDATDAMIDPQLVEDAKEMTHRVRSLSMEPAAEKYEIVRRVSVLANGRKEDELRTLLSQMDLASVGMDETEAMEILSGLMTYQDEIKAANAMGSPPVGIQQFRPNLMPPSASQASGLNIIGHNPMSTTVLRTGASQGQNFLHIQGATAGRPLLAASISHASNTPSMGMGQPPSLEMQDTNTSSNINRDSLVVQNGNSHEFQPSGNYGRQVSYAVGTHNPTTSSLPNSNPISPSAHSQMSNATSTATGGAKGGKLQRQQTRKALHQLHANVASRRDIGVSQGSFHFTPREHDSKSSMDASSKEKSRSPPKQQFTFENKEDSSEAPDSANNGGHTSSGNGNDRTSVGHTIVGINDEKTGVFPTQSNVGHASTSTFGLLRQNTDDLFATGFDNNDLGKTDQILTQMITNQEQLRMQQAQLEAAMVKMELLDQLKEKIPMFDPSDQQRSSISNVPRISSLVDLNALQAMGL